MSRADEPDEQLAERVRAALAADPQLHELGIEVTVSGPSRRVNLTGVVATRARRARAAAVALRVLPGFRIENDVAIQQLSTSEPEAIE